MPIKDKERAKQYFKEYMAKRRKGLTVKPNESNSNVKPLLNQESVKPVKPIQDNFVKPEPSVKPINVKPEKEIIKSCSLNHYSFNQLFKETSEKVKKDFQTIYTKYPDTLKKCFDCHNRERNYQIMLRLLNDYERKSKYEKEP
jgi:hypothetical protein